MEPVYNLATKSGYIATFLVSCTSILSTRNGEYLEWFLTRQILVICVYRVALHPLRKYPGPKIAKLSDIWSGYYAFRQNLHLETRDCILKYGPVVRLGPNKLVFSTIQAAQDIYLNERLNKSRAYEQTAVVPGMFSMFNALDKSVHSFKRKLVGQAVSERSMRIFEPVMLGQIDILLRILARSSEQSETVDLSPCIKRLSFDITALLAFGSPLNTQTDATYRGIVDAQTLGTYRTSIFIQYPFLRKTKIFDLVEVLSKEAVTQYYHTLEKLISTRVAEEKHARHDLYSLIVDQINPDGQCLIDSDIWAEASFFFPAGAETVSTLMCATLFYLAHNSRAYAQLAKEIRETFDSSSDIRGGPKLSSCKYLRACLDESMRMSPPAPGMSWRELDVNDPTGEPFMVDGHVVTKNTEVAISVYSILHNEEYFPNSFEYRPDRWLETETPAEQRKVMLQAFTPFSLGSRNCGGRAMAYAESSLVVAKIMWFFDFELAPGVLGKIGEGGRKLGKGREREGEYQLYDQFVADHKGPNLVFRQRGDLCKELTQS